MQVGRWDSALGEFRAVLAVEPNRVDARRALAECLVKTARLDLAEQELIRVMKQEPGSLEAHQLLGHIFYSLGRWGDFQAEIDRFRALDPDMDEGGPPGRFASSASPLALPHGVPVPSPATPSARAYLEFEQGFLDLLFGRMPQGWEGHEARLRIPGLVGPTRTFTQPAWKGESFAGKTLLLCYEQGLGDTLMFIRYAPLAKALGGQVILEAQPSLAAVAATCPGVDRVIPRGEPLPPFDLHASLLSLPWLFRTDLSTLPAEIPYLDVPTLVPHRQVLSELLALTQGRTRIGLVWAGNPGHKRDGERSISASTLAPLGALPGVTWFSFQLGRTDVPPLPNMISLAPLLGDFSDTAYALSGMDLVITVDTALAHLAGAIGIPTLLLLTFQPDWRWMLDREDSPWYPSLHLYRQPRMGDWDSVIRRLVADLAPEAPAHS